MNEKKTSSFIGVLSMDRLFVGSKSEGLYPVLHAEDGMQFRLHYKGDVSLNEKTLSKYNGKAVQVVGDADNLRGHWRVVLQADSLPILVEDSYIDSLLAPLESKEVSSEDGLKTSQDFLPEEPSHKTNRTEE